LEANDVNLQLHEVLLVVVRVTTRACMPRSFERADDDGYHIARRNADENGIDMIYSGTDNCTGRRWSWKAAIEVDVSMYRILKRQHTVEY